jgi:hypothetical protein
MKMSSHLALFAFAIIFGTNQAQAQDTASERVVRPRVVGSTAREQQSTQQTTTLPAKQPELMPQQQPGISMAGAGSYIPTPAAAEELEKQVVGPVPTHLTPSMIQSRITEARRFLKTRPLATALTTPSIDFVTIAALDRDTSRSHLITISKQTFLTKGAEINTITSLGTNVTIRILRANGVNTALTIFTPDGKSLTPLTVEFPIERGGLFREMAYYTSAHPALLSKDLVRSGQSYVRNMLDLAVNRLRERGVAISPEIINVAERLCVVEHVDHERFRAENRLALYDEIYSLFALNEVDTYRYSVSSAGAGGMVQMIPWAYNLLRTRHPGVGLIPDFVTGMRNHVNALQAMLLYMQDTWTDLTANDEVKYALGSKLATPSELLAAGYNSNAAKLPLYLRRGGDAWRNLIPRETQMYLQIYKSFESLVPTKARTTPATAALSEN